MLVLIVLHICFLVLRVLSILCILHVLCVLLLLLNLLVVLLLTVLITFPHCYEKLKLLVKIILCIVFCVLLDLKTKNLQYSSFKMKMENQMYLATCIPHQKRTCPIRDSNRVPSRVEPKSSIFPHKSLFNCPCIS